MKNYNFYSKFSTKNSNVLLELDNYLKAPLKHYCKDTVDLILITLGNAYNCRSNVPEHIW